MNPVTRVEVDDPQSWWTPKILAGVSGKVSIYYMSQTPYRTPVVLKNFQGVDKDYTSTIPTFVDPMSFGTMSS